MLFIQPKISSARWRHRLRTTNLAEGFFRHLRRYLSRFPDCVDLAHSEHMLGCFILACEQAQAQEVYLVDPEHPLINFQQKCWTVTIYLSSCHHLSSHIC
jgi:hypothetical protein